MKTQSEYEQAIKELNHWKECLKLIGETPEEVYESWRTRQIKMFKYIRLMAVWRSKYNLLCKDIFRENE